jgi:Leucine-rich repeat (LRR) protein
VSAALLPEAPGLTPFQLSLQSNRLTKIEGLQSLVNLRELYLSHNGIEVIEGLDNNVRAELYRGVGPGKMSEK